MAQIRKCDNCGALQNVCPARLCLVSGIVKIQCTNTDSCLIDLCLVCRNRIEDALVITRNEVINSK